MSFHPNILTLRQATVLRQLAPVLKAKECYLAGGMALALHLGHRRSADLDWFTDRKFDDPLLLADSIRQAGIPFQSKQADEGTLHGSVSRVRISLLYYPYARLENLVLRAPAGVPLLSLADLAAMKLAAVSGRGRRRDFIDVFALGQRHFTLMQMIDLYRQKYRITDIVHLLRSLTYFDDADRERMPTMFWDTNWKTIKQTIRRWVKDASNTLA